MSIWYDHSNIIECPLESIVDSCNEIGQHYVGVVALMPGLTSVELVSEQSNSVVIKTNEGLMKRNNISITNEKERLVIEYDEAYQAGKAINVESHVKDEFSTSDGGVKHRLVISDVKATGMMGFLYKNFGKSSIGKSLLGAYKEFFEQ